MSEIAGLTVDHLSTTLQDGDRRFRLIVEGFSVPKNGVVAITGPSGSGKTLFLELLGLLRAPDPHGGYTLHQSGIQTDLAGLWQHGPRFAGLAVTRGRLFGFVPQGGALIPFLTVGENIALTQRIAGREDAGYCAALIDQLGLSPVVRLRPQSLSMGQRQRAAIARALAHRPPFVIADEPTAALDPDAADAVMALLLQLARENGTGVVLSSHDLARLDRLGLRQTNLVSETVGSNDVLSTLAVP